MKTDHYYLKAIVQSDIENIYKGLGDPEVTQYYDVHFETLEETQEQMDWYHGLVQNGTGAWWGIYNIADDSFCGAGGYNSLEKEHQKAEIGFWLVKEKWGRGIMKEVMPLIFELGFSDLNLNRIEGYVLSANDKCKKALEKINFTHEGTMRQFEFRNGEWIDVDIYALLKSEWK